MTAATADAPSPPVVTALYLRTKTLHVEAERTGIIRDLLRRRSHPRGLCSSVAQSASRLPGDGAGTRASSRFPCPRQARRLTDWIARRRSKPTWWRCAGAHWSQGIPLLSAGEFYARRIAKAAEGDGTRLIAHAYTRYLGDLSGGQILQRLLARSLDLQPSELSFYDFSRFPDLDALKTDYRQALDSAGALAADPQMVIEEGAIAFSLNIDLSCAVKAMLSSGPIAAAAEP